MNIINSNLSADLEKVVFINQQTIKLTITYQPGTCCKCQIAKEIRLIAQRNDRSKEYCRSCSLHVLYQLEQSNYQFANKEQIIKELQAELNNEQVKKLWSDYYACKKPTCFSCLQQGIKENEYNFCGSDCLVRSWVRYQGQGNLKGRVENYITN